MCRIVDFIVAIFLVVAGYKDWKTKRISVLLLIWMTLVIIAAHFTLVQNSVWNTVGGIAVGTAFFLASRYGKEAVGYGDSWIIMLLGIYLGGMQILQLVLAASFLASLFSLLYCAQKGWSKKRTIPFVPFLAMAYVGVVIL